MIRRLPRLTVSWCSNVVVSGTPDSIGELHASTNQEGEALLLMLIYLYDSCRGK